jgi:CheY-like chemotaxis protein
MNASTLLCVDDDVEVLEGLRRRLRRTELHFLAARSAREALEYLSRVPIDILLVDEYMPGMLGSHLLELVRLHWPRPLRIAMTGLPGPGSLMRNFECGAAETFLVKPFSQARLFEALALRRQI